MVMMIKDFIKNIKEEFGNDIEFKATSFKDNKIYKSKNYDKIEKDIRLRKRVDTKALW
jgi:pantothenate kinase type III